MSAPLNAQNSVINIQEASVITLVSGPQTEQHNQINDGTSSGKMPFVETLAVVKEESLNVQNIVVNTQEVRFIK